MEIKIIGKDLKATEAIKEYVEKKLERVAKYYDGEIECSVTIKVEKNVQIAEMQVNAKGDMFRAVTEHSDLYASIDKDIDILEGQIRKSKTKKEKANKEESLKQKTMESFGMEAKKVEDEILKTSYYDIKPMTPEDAKLKLQERKDRFMPFVNIETGKVNVIFKLKDDLNYGLLEPEA